MSKESFKRPTTEVFKKASEKNLLGKEKDWCNPKNLPEIRDAEDVLKKEEAEVKYDSGQYLVNNLWLLLGKTSLDNKARTLAYQEIRSAWDTSIDDAYNSDGEDPHGFKEKKIYNLYWLSSRFKLPEKCKKLQLKDGEIRFLDKDGKAILSFSVDLKSSARRIAESEEMLVACKDERKEKGKKTAEKIVEQGEPEAAKPVEEEKPAEDVKPVEIPKSVEAWEPVEPAKPAPEVAKPAEVAEKTVSFLDKARNFSDAAIKKAKSQRAVAAGERLGRRGEEESKPIEVVEPMKPAEIPAPNGTARPAETAGSAPFGRRSAEAAKPVEAVKPVEVAKRKKPKKEVVRPVVPVQVVKPIEPAKSIEVAKPVEAEKPIEPARPIEIAKPEAPKKAEPAKAAEVPAEPIEPEEEKVEAAGNVYKELPPEILPLLNRNGRFSIVVLGGRKDGEGGGAGLFDTMKQVIFDPASNKLVVVSYSRDAYLADGSKLNRVLKRKPEEAQKVLGELSGEAAPFYITIGLKEAVEIFDIIIKEITGPIKIDLSENYVVEAGGGREYFFPKKTVISDGNTMLAFMQFRHGWKVPDDYVSTGHLSKSKLKGYPTVGADDSLKEANSRMARQDLGLTAILHAFKEKMHGKGKLKLGWEYGSVIKKIHGIVSENTNMPLLGELEGLMALGKMFSQGKVSKESLYLHYGSGEVAKKNREKLKKDVKSKFPTNIAFYEQNGKRLRE